MRLPRLRFSLRLLMVVVASSALVIAAWTLRQRAGEYRKRAASYARQEQSAISARDEALRAGQGLRRSRRDATEQREELIASLKESIGRYVDSIDEFLPRDIDPKHWEQKLVVNQEEVDLHARDAAHFGQLRRKYERLARYPWLPVEPDPLPVRPDDRAAYWLTRGDYGRALEAYEEMDRLYPNSKHPTEAYCKRAWIWATCPDARYRNGRRAVESATSACSRDGCVTPHYLDTLAAAYAEAGEFETAARWEKDALGRVGAGSPEWQSFSDRLALYQQGKPYRDEPKMSVPDDQ